MSGSRIVRLRAYGVVPPAPAVRYRGQDPLETMAMELLRLTLEDGSEGVAGTLSGWRGALAGRLVGAASDLAPVLVGQDAAHRGVLTRTALEAHDGNGLPEIESLADIAMWDAWGRHLGVPVWQMLGGFRERIPAYASTQAFHSIEAYLDEARRAAAMGYRAVKFHMNGDPAFDLEMVATVAAAFAASDLRFMVDLEQGYGFDQAVRLGRALDGLPFAWMEAPLPDEDLDAYAELNRAVAIDILPAGNSLVGLDAWTRGLDRGAWSRLRCGVDNCGGITAAVAVMALAQARGVPVELQSFGHGPAQAANLHVMLGVPGCTWFEHPFPSAAFDHGARNPPALDAEGRVAPPEGPGLGLEMDWARIEAEAVARFDSAG
ncbi:MAG: mandelate racemase/muconate lactonizing enzyme family protein [Proteobacteria bacterium]|nr:mandelate racemase/muconate lactonizing enzyme family protein [Pseudomonadota bacterium]